ncbi:hypothetical protein BH10BAC4_BH10BAC4_17260 [soil metagenome]
MNVEVFRTDVKNSDHARGLIDIIHDFFPGCYANFDLDDCDHILRIKSFQADINSRNIVDLLAYHGYSADVLEDEVIPEVKSLR